MVLPLHSEARSAKQAKIDLCYGRQSTAPYVAAWGRAFDSRPERPALPLSVIFISLATSLTLAWIAFLIWLVVRLIS